MSNLLRADINFFIKGDGLSTVITVDILQPPISAPWASNLPSNIIFPSAQFDSEPFNTPITATLVGSRVTISFGRTFNFATIFLTFVF